MSRNRVAAALIVAIVLGIGLFGLQRWVAQTKGAALVLVAAWFVVVGIAIVLAARSRPELRRAALGTYAAIGVATIAIGYWTGVRDEEVDEDVVVPAAAATEEERAQGLAASAEAGGGPKPQDTKPQKPRGPVELASGSFAGVDGHAGAGKATVVRAPSGERTLTFTEFDVDPGPTVEVYLTRDPGEIDDRIELGQLKGNVGDQQYPIPGSADLGAYDTVVLYCIPFTVRIAVAPLQG